MLPSMDTNNAELSFDHSKLRPFIVADCLLVVLSNGDALFVQDLHRPVNSCAKPHSACSSKRKKGNQKKKSCNA
jgi:hypothetical protein